MDNQSMKIDRFLYLRGSRSSKNGVAKIDVVRHFADPRHVAEQMASFISDCYEVWGKDIRMDKHEGMSEEMYKEEIFATLTGGFEVEYNIWCEGKPGHVLLHARPVEIY